MTTKHDRLMDMGRFNIFHLDLSSQREIKIYSAIRIICQKNNLRKKLNELDQIMYLINSVPNL